MNTVKIINNLKTKGIVTTKDLLKMGISKPTLTRLVKEEKINHLARGLYIHPDSEVIKPEELDFIVATRIFGKRSVIGGLTALFHYVLVEQVPQQIWLIVPSDIKTRDNQYRLIRTKKVTNEGVIDNRRYRITSIERTLIDALIYSSKIGIRTAIEAITRAIKRKQTTIKKISDTAVKMKQDKVLKKYWESIIGAISA
jgi:predicted transcriptional regulator of viral defense system